MKHFLILLLCIPLISRAAEIADIAFESAPWTYTDGVSFNGVTGELTIVGSTTEYRRAYLSVNVPNGTTDAYLSAQVYFESITAGSNLWEVPKFKMYPGAVHSGSSIKTCNYGSPIENSWYSTYCHESDIDGQGLTQITIEFGVQNAEGTFKIKVPTLLDEEPVTTPYSFPYPIPTNTDVTLDLNTNDLEAFNDDLISSNCHFNWTSQSWADPNVKDALENDFPHSNYRFPGGTVANYYDYITDGYQNHYSTFNQPFMQTHYNNNWQFGYEGFKNQVLNSGGTATLLFNMMHDSPADSKARLQSRLNDGLDIAWIELGNENFFPEQAYGNISDGDNVVNVANYISHTKAVTTELKTVDPNIKVAVVVNHLTYDQGSWSDELAKEDYFDATVVHNYINIRNEELNFTTGSQLINSYAETKHVFDEYKTHFGNTPALVTEWGVQGAPNSFLSVLAYADIFMALLDHGVDDGIVAQAGIHMFYHSDSNLPQTLIYLDGNTTKYTPQGVMYSKLMHTFKGKSLYNNASQADSLASDLPGVIARAVDYGDSIKVFAVNKLPTSSTLNISLNGSALNNEYTLEYFTHDVTTGWPSTYNSLSDAWVKSSGTGVKTLPAYSINVVTIAKNNINVVTDCNGDVDGTAILDDCGVCSGGLTGVTPSSPTTWYADNDNDGLGDPNETVQNCTQPDGYVDNADDGCPNDENNTCNDPVDCNGDINGTATLDACGICSGGLTGVTPSSPTTWYADTDNDGLGNPNNSVEDCNQPVGYVANADDDCPEDSADSCVTSSLSNATGSSIVLYPNPIDDNLTISKSCNWKLFDIYGNMLAEGNGTNIEMSQYSTGVYTLVTDSTSHKIMKR